MVNPDGFPEKDETLNGVSKSQEAVTIDLEDMLTFEELDKGDHFTVFNYLSVQSSSPLYQKEGDEIALRYLSLEHIDKSNYKIDKDYHPIKPDTLVIKVNL